MNLNLINYFNLKRQLAADSTSQDTLVFTTLSDLALFYNFSSSYASNITAVWKAYALYFSLLFNFLFNLVFLSFSFLAASPVTNHYSGWCLLHPYRITLISDFLFCYSASRETDRNWLDVASTFFLVATRWRRRRLI